MAEQTERRIWSNQEEQKYAARQRRHGQGQLDNEAKHRHFAPRHARKTVAKRDTAYED